MDLRQRFTEEYKFEIQEWFIEKIVEVSTESRIEILDAIASVVDVLPIQEGWEQKMYGVTKSNIFYSVEYIKEEEGLPLIIDLEYVEVNDYLDAILRNNSIQSYYEKKIQS
ncbi:MAG TPA: hypothetical protein DCW83_08185 [Saprospirales bacterium]|jgi:hypothetical protein|nr:hypothetical protein [Saprospirales bacterium]|tara:strand:- start:1233 stop:1565 length:333 start_codon:yes stop_codon:yes gene_type:complete